MLTSILKDRHLIAEMVRRDLKDRYAGSLLGVVWNVIHPLVMIFIYTVIFAKVMGTKLPGIEKDPVAYSVYLCCGLFPWLAFQDILNRVTNQFVDNAALIQRAVFRKEVLIWVIWLSALVTFAISFCVFLCFLVGIDLIRGQSDTAMAAVPVAEVQAVRTPETGPSQTAAGRIDAATRRQIKLGETLRMAQRDKTQPWLNLPVIPPYLLMVFCLTMLATGLGTALACLHVFLRDTAQLVGVVLLFWFWLTPIVWPFNPPDHPRLAKAMLANPLYWYIRSFQRLIVYQELPGWKFWVATAGLAAAAIVVGSWILKRAEPYLADEL